MVRTRREFLADVGRGMLLAGLGTSLAHDLDLAPAWADETGQALSFGPLEPLVGLMQDTPPEKLMPLLVERLRSGTDLKTLAAAGALANARTFGGEDYVGFHTFMAIAPAYRMAGQSPAAERPLPVLKVLFRNARRIQEFGGRNSEVLRPVAAPTVPASQTTGERLREDTRRGDVTAAETTFAALAAGPIGEAFHHLQFAVEDEVDVHRVVLAWRAWDTLEIAGPAWGHTLLRQSVRYCAQTERQMKERAYPASPVRTVLPKLLDDYHLVGRPLGTQVGDDRWLSELAETIFRGSREQAADAAAQALRDGYTPEAVGQALSLAANRLVLHDAGRLQQWATPEKPAGSCHGDSVGVHASDAANAWRSIAGVSDPRTAVCSLLVGAFHTGGQSERSNQAPCPLPEHLAELKTDGATDLIQAADAAIRQRDQFRAAAAIHHYGKLGHESGPVFDLLLKYATSEDGALHGEKYFHTVQSEFVASRPAFRWGQLVALARVTASEYGQPAAGYEQAKRLLS